MTKWTGKLRKLESKLSQVEKAIETTLESRKEGAIFIVDQAGNSIYSKCLV
jgi:hypothetical protein